MSKEVWRDIEGYEGKYQVSNKGRVKSLNYHRSGKEVILKQCKSKDGYLKVCLFKNGKETTFSVHRIVALAFINNYNNCPEINHKDEDKTNNCVENLEWCDRKYNVNYGSAIEKMVQTRKLRKKILCIETNQIFNSCRDAGKSVNVDHGNISKCANGIYETSAGYHWKYILED